MKKMLIGSALFLLAFACPDVRGQDVEVEDTETLPVQSEETALIFGTVLDVTPDFIRLRYYDQEKELLKDEVFQFGEATKFEDAYGIQDIRNGDSVEIEYRTVKGERVIRYITLNKSKGRKASVAKPSPAVLAESLKEAGDKFSEDVVGLVAEELEKGEKKVNREDQEVNNAN